MGVPFPSHSFIHSFIPDPLSLSLPLKHIVKKKFQNVLAHSFMCFFQVILMVISPYEVSGNNIKYLLCHFDIMK